MLQPGRHIHVVGVGGFGMSAIARVLLQRGYTLSGSDLRANEFTHELAALGAVIYEGHRAENIAGADVVVTTSAAKDDNPEIAAARAAGIPVLRRRDMLGELMAGKIGIAVAGTHGKTTTTALMVHVLMEAGRDPTYIVGGVMKNTGTNAGVGQGPYFVVEADEYDRMFLGLRPQIAIVTNIDHDHPDCFPTMQDVRGAFEEFVARLPDDGLLVVCADDPEARELGLKRREAGKPVEFYTVSENTLSRYSLGDGWYATFYSPDPAGGWRFSLRQGKQPLARLRVNLEGGHNVHNALAVIAVARYLGVPLGVISKALKSFQGTRRRSEIMGQAGGVTVINDYAHHPTAIRVTLAAHDRRRSDVRRLWAVWQPHTYGRMRALADRFKTAFMPADYVLVTDVYSVREAITPGLDAAGMADIIRDFELRSHIPPADVRYTGSLEATAQILINEVQPGDRVVILSAGDAPRIGEMLLAALRSQI
jgi:UDP-N-acetylmuramate--alanine ligase